MNKIAYYLQEHLSGEVLTGTDARRYFAKDNSIFNIAPSVIVYAKDINDVRKTARFTWQLAERNRLIPITCRGNGSDLTGGAIGSGIILVFSAYLNKITDYDAKDGLITAQSGINFGKLQHQLKTDQLYIPAAPFSQDYSSLGGAVANNASGLYSTKYGSMVNFIEKLEVVLANGELIEVKKLSKKELNVKLGLTTLEGDIYRAIDSLLDENLEEINRSQLNLTKNTSGYNLRDIKAKDGTFSLIPLLTGSQGTLAYISAVTLQAEIYNPERTLIVADIDSIEDLNDLTQELNALNDLPSAFEFIDINLLNFVDKINENFLINSIEKPFPNFVVFIEYDEPKAHRRSKQVKRTEKILAKYSKKVIIETDPEKQDNLWKIRFSSSLAFGYNEGLLHPLPLTDDMVVPVDKFGELISYIYDLYSREHLNIALWGHPLDANVHLLANLNIAHVGDRQKAFRMQEECASKIEELGGSLTGRYNDGRLRGPYLDVIYPPKMYELFSQVKQIFDPYNIVNPGVKINVTKEEIKPMLRSDYSLDHIYDHLPIS